jgi:hypothetical protein
MSVVDLNEPVVRGWSDAAYRGRAGEQAVQWVRASDEAT